MTTKTLTADEAAQVNKARDRYWRLVGSRADATGRILRELGLPEDHPAARELLDSAEDAVDGLVVDLYVPPPPAAGAAPVISELRM